MKHYIFSVLFIIPKAVHRQPSDVFKESNLSVEIYKNNIQDCGNAIRRIFTQNASVWPAHSTPMDGEPGYVKISKEAILGLQTNDIPDSCLKLTKFFEEILM